jgi:broad specificity phosphatase PhoE
MAGKYAAKPVRPSPPHCYAADMNAPRVARAGRPFLAPIWTAILAAALVFGVLAVGVRLVVLRLAEQTTFVLLRHAEKSLEPTGDPLLTAAGEARAVRLAYMLGSGGGGEAADNRISAVYASDTRRAQLTAAPLAERLALDTAPMPAGKPGAVIRELLGRHRGQTVVVVGHSNTVPEMVAELSGGRASPVIADAEFDSIFVVTVNRAGAASVLRLRY